MALEEETGRAPWYDAWLIVLVAPAVVACCLGAPFLGFDDQEHVGRASIAPGAPWYEAFRAVPGAGDYFPITLLSYRFDRWFYGSWLHLLFPASGNAPGYRLTSLLIHLASALVLWRIFLRLKAGRWCSLFAAAAWAAHPAACESVAWVSERKNVLAAFFGFLALWFWMREWDEKRQWLREPAAFGLYLLILLSKPVGAGFFFVFAAYEVCYRRSFPFLKAAQERKNGVSAKRSWPAWAALLAMALATAVLAWVNIRGEERELTSRLGGSVLNTIMTDLEILRLYISNMLAPAALSFFYQVEAITSIASPSLWISIGFLAACVFVSLWLADNRKTALFLWGWFLGALLPTLNIVPKWNQMQDRYAYFSLPALLLLLALSVAGLARRLKIPPLPRLACVAVLSGVASLAAMGAIRSSLFDNNISLYHDALLKQPQAIFIHEYLGIALTRDTERAVWQVSGGPPPEKLRACREEALEHFNTVFNNSLAGKFLFDKGRLLLDAGILNMRLGHLELARQQLQTSTKELPRELIWNALVALSELDLDEGRPGDALDHAQQAAVLSGSIPRSLYWLGRAHENRGDGETALRAYRMIPPKDLVGPAAAERIRQLTPAEKN